MERFERNLNRIYVLSGLVLITMVVMAMSSCGTTKRVKKCCEKTVQEVYEYEGWVIDDCENCDEID